MALEGRQNSVTQTDISDSAREREVYRYYQPNPDAETCQPLPQLAVLGHVKYASPSKRPIVAGRGFARRCSPDTALTAFTQLVAWRMGADRAIISLVDGSNQYFLAESTKSLDLQDPSSHDAGDELWLGCGASAKKGGLCEQTIMAIAEADGLHPAFIVPNLAEDPRYQDAPFVAGPPYLRFHAGVPLVTKRGIPIGSLFVVDKKPRAGLTKEQRLFMGTMSGTIMKHLEMVREVEEHRRGMKMSRGLASFVEGRSQLAEDEADDNDGEGSRIAGNFEFDQVAHRSKSKSGSIHSLSTDVRVDGDGRDRLVHGSLSGLDEVPQDGMVGPVRPELAGSHLDSFSQSQSTPQDLIEKSPGDDGASEGTSMKMLFSRAANLIREAFEVNGGAVFYDAQKGFISESQKEFGDPGERPMQSETGTSGEESTETDASSDGISLGMTSSKGSPGLDAFTRSSSASTRDVEILGFSTPNASSMNNDEYPGRSAFLPFDERALQTLLKRYPRGRLWIFDSDGSVPSSSEEDATNRRRSHMSDKKEIQRQQRRRMRNLSDGRFLHRHFPGVRQLLFIPLWDAGRARWLSACCVWSTERTRILTRQNELSFLNAFGNSVMAECYRLDTEVANQKKGDFIGSISHELRSPLHGILASAEFLSEEKLSGFEKGLVETIDSCGRTLLDTINHILDFSKINHFEKNWKRRRRYSSRLHLRSGQTAAALRQSNIPMINLFADVDVAVVCEEVVDSVVAGHVFQNVTAQSFDMVSGPHGKMADMRKQSVGSQTPTTTDSLVHTPVAVILDISHHAYEFTTQPGALRRIIMNLLGNALKYTSHGYVKLTLDASPMDDLSVGSNATTEVVTRSLITLTVTDTGKGISSDFLRSKLFTPFAQENSLSSGTGLGLSIVRSIVSLLEGEITFDSEVGRGTQVKVSLPLLREKPKHTPKGTPSTGTPRSVTSMPREIDETISLLRARLGGKNVALYGFDSNIAVKDPIQRRMLQFLKASVINYVENWYGLKVVQLAQNPSIIIANEVDQENITQIRRSTAHQKLKPAILVLCSQTFDRPQQASDSVGVSFIAKPTGPLKLARALKGCLDGALPLSPQSVAPGLGAHKLSSGEMPSVYEETSPLSTGGEILDNSRMAADSDNARKVLESPTPHATIETAGEFPFHIPQDDIAGTGIRLAAEPKRTSALAQSLNHGEGQNPTVLTTSEGPSGLQEIGSAMAGSAQKSRRIPSLLIVDDNKINLRLLRTFMQKRKYHVIDEAENGLEAVQKVRERQQGYDIIFMDISMPVLDGFGATKEIRSIEKARRSKATPDGDGAGADGLIFAEASARRTASTDDSAPLSPLSKAGEPEPGSSAAAVLIEQLRSKLGLSGSASTDAHSAAQPSPHPAAPRPTDSDDDPSLQGPPPPPTPPPSTGALVIALTGLATSSDQSQAFECGIDLFLTKPVAFREVGKLLDNWEANCEREELV